MISSLTAATAFLLLNRAVAAVQKATEAGTSFVFGYLGGGELPFAETRPGATFVFAFRALRMVLVVLAGTVPFGAFFAERYVTRVWRANQRELIRHEDHVETA